MASYKSGVAIIVTYQAAAVGTGLTIKMDIYDEGQAFDSDKSIAAMSEIGTTGRYYATFTPDAAGEWIALMYKSGGGGDVVKAFRVATVDEFGIKTVADAIQAKTDIIGASVALESGGNVAAVKAKTDLIGASVAPSAEYDTQMGTGERASASALTAVDTVVDAVQAKTDLIGASVALETGGKLATVETATGATGGIRGADGDSLKTLSDQIDLVASPAMVG